ncbi:MAG TPA: hypothetical protein VNT99_20285, partial [Methylomirabilota bacterium]|nr:hypothetical protein [Methylomirabilota bacterium]
AIELFRANLIAYVGKARPVLEDACDEVFRTRQWLQQDRRVHWENQLRKRRKALEEAEQALFAARLGNLREATSAEVAAVTRAKRAFNEAEEKLRLVKRWTLEFDNRVQPLVKELEGLRTLLANDMPKAAAHLAQVIKTLDAYAGVKLGGMMSGMTTSDVKPTNEPTIDASIEPTERKA